MKRECTIDLEGNDGTICIEHSDASITLIIKDSKGLQRGRRFVNYCTLCGEKSPAWFAYETNIFVSNPNLIEKKK